MVRMGKIGDSSRSRQCRMSGRLAILACALGLVVTGCASRELVNQQPPDRPSVVSTLDEEAKDNLMNAMAAARAFGQGRADGLATFDANAAQEIEPALRYSDDESKVGIVSIRFSSALGLLLTTKGTSGRYYCIATVNYRNASTTRYGQSDRDYGTVASCLGPPKYWAQS